MSQRKNRKLILTPLLPEPEPSLWQRFPKTITTIAALIISVGGATTYWTAWGWPVPAMRGYVDYRVNPIELAQGKYDQFILNFNLQQVEAEITKWQRELPTIGNSQTRALVQERIKVLETQRGVLTRQINEHRK